MKIASYSSSNNPVKGSFSTQDGDLIRLDFTQGAHGRAFCGNQAYDLPDPKNQLVSVSNMAATLEITGPQGMPAPMGQVVVRTLKARGDITMPVLRVEKLDLAHSSLTANEVSGPKNEVDPEMEADPITNIRMLDSNLITKGDLVFIAIETDDKRPSLVKAGYLEGMTTQGHLTLQANDLAVYVLDAHEVRVTDPAGCRVGKTFCERVFQQNSLGQPVRKVAPVRDPDLLSGLSRLVADGDEIEGMGEPAELDAQGFEM
jgi:hypothetical protein